MASGRVVVIELWHLIYIVNVFIFAVQHMGMCISNVDMWVGTRSAMHSKSLERRCLTAVRMFPGCYYTRCALTRTDGRLYTCSSD